MQTKKKSIAILTQPLGHNYGGLLQAYALTTYLKGLGHDVQILDRRKQESWEKQLKTHIANVLRMLKGLECMNNRTREIVFQHLHLFRDTLLDISVCLDTEQKLRRYVQENRFDAFVVGSDQVWRPKYSPSILNFYLDFLNGIKADTKRISYAASFGVDEWEYSPEDTRACAELIRQFDAISVREESGKGLCQQYLGVDAEWVLDPTFLLTVDTYNKLIQPENSEAPNAGKLLTYILDPHAKKQAVAGRVAEVLGKELFSVKPLKEFRLVKKKEIEACIYPGIGDWVKGFRDAEFVVTDSFHGCVFSIIFNKPFIAVGNYQRGVSRFTSLLSLFGLESRLVSSVDDLDDQTIKTPIDWEAVNEKKQEKMKKSTEFIIRAIT